jgi:hypothetical protein
LERRRTREKAVKKENCTRTGEVTTVGGAPSKMAGRVPLNPNKGAHGVYSPVSEMDLFPLLFLWYVLLPYGK